MRCAWSVVARRPSATDTAGPQLLKPFGDNALALHERELAVIPCAGDDGKNS